MAAVVKKVIGIVCPLQAETKFLLPRLRVLKKEKLNGSPCFQAEYAGQQICLVVSGIGKANTARTSQALIERHSPRYLINFGTAGGIAPGIKAGEVIASSQAIEYDSPQAAPCPADSFLLQQASSLPGIKTGVIASAEKDAATFEQRNRLWQTCQALCCDWESAVLLRVARQNRVPAIALRVISDVGQQPLEQEFKANLPRILPPASQLLLEFIQKL